MVDIVNQLLKNFFVGSQIPFARVNWKGKCQRKIDPLIIKHVFVQKLEDISTRLHRSTSPIITTH